MDRVFLVIIGIGMLFVAAIGFGAIWWFVDQKTITSDVFLFFCLYGIVSLSMAFLLFAWAGDGRPIAIKELDCQKEYRLLSVVKLPHAAGFLYVVEDGSRKVICVSSKYCTIHPDFAKPACIHNQTFVKVSKWWRKNVFSFVICHKETQAVEVEQEKVGV